MFYPDDHSRVILEPEEGDPDSDYVNANYIDVSGLIPVIEWAFASTEYRTPYRTLMRIISLGA